MVQIGLVLALFGCQSAPDRSTDDSTPGARELVDLRSRILAYTADLEPDAAYSPPDDTQRERVAESVGHLLDGDATKAERLLDPLGLKLTRLTDTESGRRYDEIAASGPGRAERWGRLYLTADSDVRWNAQVPHPVSDRDTERLGVRLLEDNPGGSLVLAGAHRDAGRRDAADVAHRADSVFHAIVVELQKRDVPGVQLHGFAKDSDRPYEAVLSTGAARSTLTEAAALADAMQADGLRVCRGWSARCPLEGATNVQGKAAERHHAKFLHVELSPKARGDGNDADAATAALSGLVTTWNSARR
ncbi:N-formylglutamate amidohydrolase OS=Streptomyces violarus OX=67380 GN=FHS41_002841 PE=4 SV=1 [Streptomyces violarus]